MTLAICDCGQVYHSDMAVQACQADRHTAAANNELVDAMAFAASVGAGRPHDPRPTVGCAHCGGMHPTVVCYHAGNPLNRAA